MIGETNLHQLLASMNPQLRVGEFVYCTVYPLIRKALTVEPVCEFHEDEGITLIVRREEAEAAGLSFQYPCRMITLQVQSSLEAVGFLATICTQLAKQRISVNTVSAYFHDHLFVPAERAQDAIDALQDLAHVSRGTPTPQ